MSNNNSSLSSSQNSSFTIDLDKIENKEAKEALAQKVLNKVKDGQTIGFGSGTTSYITAVKIGKKVQKEHLNITAVPTSNEIQKVCEHYGIKIGNLIENELDWAFDGADKNSGLFGAKMQSSNRGISTSIKICIKGARKAWRNRNNI